LVLAILHLAIVLMVVGKYAMDRNTLPRAWALVAPFDPELPVRGRYVRLAVHADPGGTFPSFPSNVAFHQVRLKVENGRLIATPFDGPGNITGRFESGASAVVISDAVAFFLPEHVPDPSRRPAGEELWAELSIPRKGPPRPVRLGVKKSGVLTPLDLN
jgi:hypothetical protein